MDLSTYEERLADTVPFGSCDYIHQVTWKRYEQRLKMLEAHMPDSTALLAAVRDANPDRRYRVLGDPVLRNAINSALGHYLLHVEHLRIDDLAEVMREAIPFLAGGRTDTPLTAGFSTERRLGDEPHHGWLYSPDGADTAFTRGFVNLWDSVTELRPKAPSEEEHRVMMAGVRLLETLLPRLARSALAHAHVVVLIEPPTEGFTSVTFPDVLGSFTLAPRTLSSPWTAAEFLLHEAMHCKFVDLEHTHSLIRNGYRDRTSPVIRPPWHRPAPNGSRDWSVKRCLTVAHVYATLALFFTAVDRRATELEGTFGPLGELRPALEARRSFDRAHFLVEALRGHEAELGAAGTSFVEWLAEIIDTFDPSPPTDDVEVRLVRDMYERETEELRTLLERRAPTPLTAELLDTVTRRELEKVGEIRALFGEGDADPRRSSEQGSVETRFLQARRFVVQSLRELPVVSDGERRQQRDALAERLREMVNGSVDDVRSLEKELSAR